MVDSLIEDEAKLANYAAALLQAVEDALPKWVEQAVVSRTSETRFEEDSLLLVATHQAQVDAARTILPKMRVLLRLDIDRQRATPLEVIRKGVPFPTRVLELGGVEPVERDEFAKRQFPNDVYGLTPMSLADVHESLQVPGLEWGAAKAHVHLRRRRAAGETEVKRVAAFVPNLMDRGKILGSLPTPEWLNGPAAIARTDADLVIVDLSRLSDLSVLKETQGWTVGYGPHVEEDLLAEAEEHGCKEVLPRSVFFRRLAQSQIRVR